jgi:hypothetical protein
MSRVSKGMVGTTRDDANVSIPTHLGGSVDSLEYVVTVGLGTPPVSQVVLMDTGKDLSWVQCKPCNSTTCYPQNDPLFDPSKSSTFSGGATIDLDVPNGILSDDCLAFRESGPDDQPGILGNVNQRRLEVLYDVGRGRVGFRAAAC